MFLVICHCAYLYLFYRYFIYLVEEGGKERIKPNYNQVGQIKNTNPVLLNPPCPINTPCLGNNGAGVILKLQENYCTQK